MEKLSLEVGMVKKEEREGKKDREEGRRRKRIKEKLDGRGGVNRIIKY
jgi:hypothetical protein